MYRKPVLSVLVSVLLFSAVLGAGLVERRVDVASSGGSGPGVLSGSGESGSVDWWPMFHHDLNHTGYSTSKAPKTNQTLWTYTTGAIIAQSSPAVADGIVYIGSEDHNVYALNATTGALIWSYSTGHIVDSSPAVADGVVYVGSVDSKVYALNASTGTLVWNYTTGNYIQCSPTVAYGKVYVGSSDGKVYALNASTGTLVWNYTTGSWVLSSPAVDGDMVYVGNGYGIVYALNATTGALKWSYETEGWNGVWASPAIDSGIVYVASIQMEHSTVYALNATTGTLVWSYYQGMGGIHSSPAVANGVVYIYSTDYGMYALDATTGALIWSIRGGGESSSSPAVVDGMVFVGSVPFYNTVCALNATTGALIWTYATGGKVDSSPAVANGMVFVGSWDNKVYCFGAHDVAIVDVSSSATESYAGEIVNVTVVLRNEGTFNETFSVRTYCDSTLIGTQTVTDLPQDEEKTLTFSWNTTDVPGGYYTISANATIVPGETHTADNNFIDGTITVTSPVRIAEVIPCNQTGYPNDTFQLGTWAFFKVTINSTALIPQDTLITINLYDNANATISLGWVQALITPGTSTIIFGLSIPATAAIGTAMVYACAYTDWPSQGGFPNCPEKSATLEITGA